MSDTRNYIGPKDRAYEKHGVLWFFCPACQCTHSEWTGIDKVQWNKDLIYPTLRVTVKIAEPQRCHSRIKNGGIEYHEGSAHRWRGPYELPELREVLDVTHANDGTVLGWKKKEGGK